MIERQSDIDNLQQAINALEAQRATLGDAVVEAALAPLRSRLAELKENTLREQRRLVTVLFSDLSGFTHMSAQMDAEELREVMSAYFQRWRACIERRGGAVEKYIGDAVMAVFGVSTAHEDDPERAILAALEMARELEALNQSLPPAGALVMRVGIHTGQVITGALGDHFVAVGEAVNLASRLQTAAPDNGILISHDTYAHVRGLFDVSPLGPLELKGIQQPVPAYLILRAKPRAFRMGRRGVEGVETRMIGREGELQRLQDAFFSVLEYRERRVVTLAGEAGLGKSRLLYEFDNWVELRPETAYYFKGRAYPAMQNTPYAILRSLFAGRFQIADSDPPPVVRQKLEAGFAEGLGEDSAGRMQAHFAGRLLGFELGESEFLAGLEQDAKSVHDRALASLGDYFRALAKNSPVIALLEDLHWADDSSLDILNLLEASFAHHPVLIVCAARPALFERRPHWGEGLLFHTRLDLLPLSPRASRQLVEEILQKVEDLPQALKELVADTAEGNPFYIEELIKMLIEDGVIRKGEDRWQVEAGRLGDIRIPPTLMGVLQARFDSLAPEERACLQRGAVIGRVFWDQAVDVLVSAEGEAGDRAPAGPGAADILQRLRAREMIYQREQSTFDETVEYLFKHALLRDVTYASLLKRRRRRYHQLAARWLEQVTERTHRQEEFSMLIAEHYAAGDEQKPAAGWYGRAGRRAARQYANAEAARAFSQALKFLPAGDLAGQFDLRLEREKMVGLMGSREQQLEDLNALAELAEKLDDPRRQTIFSLRMAEYAFIGGDYPAAIQHAQRAGELARSAQDPEAEAESYLLQSTTRLRGGDFDTASDLAGQALAIARQHALTAVEAKNLRNMGLIAYYAGNPQQARQYFEQALQLYVQLGDRQGEGMALNNLGGANFNMGEYDLAREYYSRSLQLSREIGDRLGEGRATNNMGIVSVAQGQYAAAEKYYLAGLEICREVGQRSFEVSALDNLGNLALYRYQFTRAGGYHREALRVAREIGDRMIERFAVINTGHGLLLMGDYARALPLLQETLDLNAMFNDPQGKAHALFNLSFYHTCLGEFDEARRQGEQALALSLENELPSEVGWSRHYLGLAQLGLGLFEQAVQSFQQAFDLRRELGEPRETVESQAGLALALLHRGDLEQARTYAEEILTFLESEGSEGFDQPAMIYFTCSQVLQQAEDPRAMAVLSSGNELLLRVAAGIEDEGLRRSYLENVPANRQLRQAWEANRPMPGQPFSLRPGGAP